MSLGHLDALIEQARPVEGAFSMKIGSGDFEVEFFFALPATYGAWTAFKRERDEWVAIHSKLAKAPSPEWGEYWTKDADSLGAVYTLVTLSVAPSKVSDLDALKMLRAPSLVEALLNGIEARRATAIARALEGVEEAKN